MPLSARIQGSLHWKISCCVFCALLCIFLVDVLVGWVASSSQKALIKIQAGSTSKCERLTKLVMAEGSEWTNLKSFVATESCSVGVEVFLTALPCLI